MLQQPSGYSGIHQEGTASLCHCCHSEVTKKTTHSLELCQSTVCCYWFHSPDNHHWFAFKGVLPCSKWDSVWKCAAYQNHCYTDVSQQRRLSHCSISHHTGLKLSQPHEWKHENMWLPPVAAHPPHVIARAHVSGEETTTPLKLLPRPSPVRALAQISFFLPGILLSD